jgi:hypothetical protein
MNCEFLNDTSASQGLVLANVSYTYETISGGNIITTSRANNINIGFQFQFFNIN